jgi:hypothetical protein
MSLTLCGWQERLRDPALMAQMVLENRPNSRVRLDLSAVLLR